MSKLNNPDNYTGRVNYAAAVIAGGRNTSRAFDNCFENYDGDAVAAALMRRAQKNERLSANLPRYINPETAKDAATRLQGRNLTEAAAEMRAKAQAEFDAWLANQRKADQ